MRQNDFKQLSDCISIKEVNGITTIMVNNEWTFELPMDLSYEVDSEFVLIEGGIDLSGYIKPLVLHGILNNGSYLFDFCLEKHFQPFGNYYTIDDCRFDDRFDDDSNYLVRFGCDSNHRIMLDDGEHYIDLININNWPLGDNVELRVRGKNIVPFNFEAFVKNMNQNDWKQMMCFLERIALSIKFLDTGDAKILSHNINRCSMSAPTISDVANEFLKIMNESSPKKTSTQKASIKKTTTKKKTKSTKIAFLEEDVKDTRKRILMKAKTFRGPVKPKGCDLKLVPLYDDKNNAEDITALSIDKLYYSDEHLSKTKELFDAGLKFSSVFHVSDKEFNPYNDRENEILSGYLRASYQLHALRSFGWTGSKYVKSAKKELSDLSIDEAIALADFIESRGGANYKSSTDVTDGFCASLRPKMEYKCCYSGAAFNFYLNNKVYAIGGNFSGKYCEMYSLVNDLYSLLPIMNEICEYIAENNETDSTLADILSAWCTFAIATRESFEIVKGDNNRKVAKTEVIYENKAETIEVNENGLYILNGWLVAIDPSKIKNDELVIPEGVEHIFPFEARSGRCLVNDSFYDIKKLKKITYPSTVKKMYWASFQNNNIIKKVVLSEGLEEIGDCAFNKTDSLEELIIPRSVSFIDDYGFGYGAHYETFKIKLKVYRGSYAERYMKEKGIKHTVI